MNSLIRAIKRNTAERKKIKKRIDSELNLSAEADNAEMVMLSVTNESDTNRLIDEGAIIEGDGSVWGYLKKGTVEKFLNGENEYLGNLPDDFVGNIDIGHLDHVTFPFPVGEWRLEDMTMVDIGDGRKGIDMNTATIDEESIFIKELKRLGYDLSMSIEAYFHTDYDASEDLGFPVFDEMLITGYAVCGDGKNVGSNGMKLKGEPMKDKKDIIEVEELDEEKELGVDEIDITVTGNGEAEAEAEAEAPTDDVQESVDESSDEDEPTEPTEEKQLAEGEEQPAEEEAEEEPNDESEGEEAEVEEVADDEEADDEDEGEEAEDDAEELAIVSDLREQIQSLNSKIEELAEANAKLKKTNRKLSAKYQNELDKKAKFKENLKGLSVELLPDEGEKKPKEEKLNVSDRNYYRGDGIGEI